MQKTLIILLSVLLLTSCSWVHKMDIEQGNVFSQDMVRQLHVGMTLSQVKEIMGSPVLINTFNDNRVYYVYTFQPGNGRMYEKRVTLTFRNGVLKNIDAVEYPCR